MESMQFGIGMTVVDSPEEMHKLHDAGWIGEILIRLAVPDNYSKQPFSKKFGAPITWISSIFDLSTRYNIPIRGLSFHVGSECGCPDQFSKALQICRQVMDMSIDAKLRSNLNIIDIGGGFLPNSGSLAAIASTIQSSRHVLFPDNKSPNGMDIRWIAEPGRFLSATCQTLYIPVIGRKCGIPSNNVEFQYTLNESIYGYFSNVCSDNQHPNVTVAYQNRKTGGKLYRSILFGHTCDGADIIDPDIQLPLLNVGDWLKVDNMGAYTNVTACEFNGFTKPDIVYVDQE
jgi:ornithine decarboxylase